MCTKLTHWLLDMGYMIFAFSHLRISSFTSSHTFELSLLWASLTGLDSSSKSMRWVHSEGFNPLGLSRSNRLCLHFVVILWVIGPPAPYQARTKWSLDFLALYQGRHTWVSMVESWAPMVALQNFLPRRSSLLLLCRLWYPGRQKSRWCPIPQKLVKGILLAFLCRPSRCALPP